MTFFIFIYALNAFTSVPILSLENMVCLIIRAFFKQQTEESFLESRLNIVLIKKIQDLIKKRKKTMTENKNRRFCAITPSAAPVD